MTIPTQLDNRYSLELVRIPGTIHEALGALKTSQPEVKAVVTGTRRTDPYSGVWGALVGLGLTDMFCCRTSHRLHLT